MHVRHLTREERINTVAPEREILPPSEVLEMIAPLEPDSIHHVGAGVYEIRWSDERQGAEEIAALCTMARVRVVTTLEELRQRPKGLPRWLAVQFAVEPLPLQTSATVS
jgi:hypothetical protein